MTSRRQRIIFSTLLLVGLFLPPPFVFAQRENDGIHRTVRVGYFYGEGFQDVSPLDGHRSGYGYDYLQNLAYYAGWKYDYVDTNWEDAINMLKAGEVDILCEVSKTPEREKHMLFAEHSMGSEEYYIYIQDSGSGIRAEEPLTLNGKTIGINAGTYQLDVFKDWCREHGVESAIVEYENEAQRNEDFLAGKLDGAVDYEFYLDEGWRPLLKIGSSYYYIAVAPGREDILGELNAAQTKLFETTPLFIERLQSQYFSHEVVTKSLNDRETAWVLARRAENRPIVLGYVDNCLPYCAYNAETGELTGALTVFVHNLKELFDIDVKPVMFTDREELFAAVYRNEVDACFPIYNMLWQTEQLGLMQTEAVFDFPQALVYRKGEYTYQPTGEQRFAVSENSLLLSAYIRDKYPGANISYYQNRAQSLKAVSDGSVDRMLINTFILSRLYENYEVLGNLDMMYLPDDAQLSIGVGFSHPELLSIFNKTIMLLDKALLTSSLVQYSRTSQTYSVRYFFRLYALPIIAVILVLSALIFALMRYQIKRIEAAKALTESLNSELEVSLEREKAGQAAVREAFDAANKANAAKTEFLASMSHDIRTPMNAIIGMTALAAANLDDTDKVKHCLSEITTSSKHLLGLINEVLDMNKIESGKVSLNESDFNLANLIDDFVSVAKTLVNAKKQEFIVNVHDIQHENVTGDSGRIQQCLMNFMSNAVKYTGEGGTIRISITEKPTNRPRIGCFEFIVEDNGIGMSEDFMKVMFEPFSRSSDSRAQKQQGTGLGMSITRNIIRMMNGDIKVESKLNEGSKFTATIFLELRNTDERIDVSSLEDLPVLVVDDDRASCESVCFVLDQLGMKGEWVLSGKEAVARVTARHAEGIDFFACIIDWKMPEMDGLATTRAIRDVAGDGVPIIIISAYDWNDIENEAREAGVKGFVPKPIFRSKMARIFLDLTGNNDAEAEQVALEKFRNEDFSGYRVLLVEDNAVNSEIAKEILGMTGLLVDTAWNGKDAVETLSASGDGYYQLVFMDIQMPVMDGYEATKAIRSSEREYLRNIPIVAMSANAFAEDVQKSLSVGMTEHIAKPLDFDHLLDILNRRIQQE